MSEGVAEQVGRGLDVALLAVAGFIGRKVDAWERLLSCFWYFTTQQSDWDKEQ